MPARPMLSVFSAGELSPLLNGRIDLSAYFKGCSQLENFLPIKQGGVIRRPGTIFVTSTYCSSTGADAVDNIVRLIPFVISETMGFVWEFTDQLITGGLQSEVYYDHACVASLVMPSLFTIDSQYLQINDIMYFVHEDHPVYKLTYTDSTTWSISSVDFTASTGDEGFSLADHYPRAIAFHDDRMILAGTVTDPNKIWGSQVGDHENFTQGYLSDEAFEFGIGSRLKHQIQWVESAEDLLIGTNMAEGVVYGSEEGITPATAFFRWISNRGSAYFQPEFIDGAVVFIDRSKKKVFQLLNDGGWKTNDLTIFADHISGDGIGSDPNVPSTANYEGEDGGFCQAVMFQRDPHPILWFVTKSGELVSCTFDKEAGMIAWSRHTTPGIGTTPAVDDNYYGPAFFRSVAVIPNILGQDEVWAQVTRWHDDNEYKNNIEYFAPIKYEDLEDGHFVDCGVDYEPGDSYEFNFTEIDVEYYSTTNLVSDPEDGTTANWIESEITAALSDLYYQGMRFTKLTSNVAPGHYLEEAIIFTGDATKSIQAIIKNENTLVTSFRLYDATAAVNRARLDITWATKDLNVVTGTLYQYEWIDDNTLWLVLTAPGVVASNTNKIQFQTDTNSTYFYFTGAQAEDSATPTGKNELKFKPITSEIADASAVIFSDIASDTYPELATALNGKTFTVVDNDPWYTITGNFIGIYTDHKDEINGLGIFKKVGKTPSSLDHLEGATVAINADGYPTASQSVASGGVSLDTYAARAHVGLAYYPKLKTMNLEVPTQSGTSQTLKARITQLFVRFYKTVSAKIGKSEDDTLETVKMREWSDPWGNINQEPFTGDRQVDFPQGYDRDKYIYITCETPTAITILGLIPDLFIYTG